LAAAIACLGIAALLRADELLQTDARYLNRQVVWLLLGGVLAAGACLPNYRWVMRAAYVLLTMSLIGLIAVYFFPSINGAKRWIRLGPIGWQPSEFAKLAFILGMARYLMWRDNLRQLAGFVPPLLLVMLPTLLILKEPDLGTSLVFFPVLFAMLYVAGARTRHLLLVALLGVSMLPVMWSQMSTEQRARVRALVVQPPPNTVPAADAYHLYQAKQVIALGGWWGSAWQGDWVDDAAAYRVPEAATDSIVCYFAERWGLAGVSVLLGLWAALIAIILRIAAQTHDPFARLTATGVATLFAVQASINAGMLFGILPITGLTMPLVSYGGSSVAMSAMALGLVANIALRTEFSAHGQPFMFAD
jgi:cell division protein FtsW (lipid II flippase)